MTRATIATFALIAALAGCTGHSYEPKEPGITISGEAGIGMKYSDGTITPATKNKITISMGGSI